MITTSAFGLTLQLDEPLAGWRPGPPVNGRPRVRIRIGPIPSATPPRAGPGRADHPRVLYDGSSHRIVREPDGGHLLTAERFGRFRVSSDAREITADPTALEPWQWQRFLIGQVLPFVSSLHGLEPFHAGAVDVAGRALVVTAASGVGKSSVVAELMLRGCAFITDDVVAANVAAGRVLVHPGPPLLSLRSVTCERLGPAPLGRLGECVGSDEESHRVAVERRDDPAVIALFCVLQLDPSAPAHGQFVPHMRTDPRPLLAATFLGVWGDRTRAARQLDVCATLASSARLIVVQLPTTPDFPAVAEALLSHGNER